eukprot:6728003-Prorocentrum_lima.AAC.1
MGTGGGSTYTLLGALNVVLHGRATGKTNHHPVVLVKSLGPLPWQQMHWGMCCGMLPVKME